MGRTGEEAVLNDRTLDEFRKLPGVVAITPLEQLNGVGRLRLNRFEGYTQIVGIDATQVNDLGLKLASGTDRLGHWQALAGARVAEGFYNPRTGRSWRNSLTYKVRRCT
jgi:hypothetical protein